jgi:hypothetical protein
MKNLTRTLLFVLAVTAFTAQAPAQSITSGSVEGTVTDQSGAALPGASVTLANLSTNTSQKTTTGADGHFRLAFVQPGTYRLTVSASAFQTTERGGIVVAAGQPVAADFQLQVAGATQTVNVTEAETSIQTENADVSTAYNAQMVRDMPNAGGDLSYIAQTAPGVVMNTQSGYGNFSAAGMPTISNLFTMDGVNYNDPFFGINNTGASNLSLGSNDIAEANVITNGYSGQYGQYAGSQITYITKSGTNSFHGSVLYNWNGRAMNANQFFLNSAGAPTPFNNFNQWGTNVNGPIFKNRTFFDFNYEGVHSLVPANANVNLIPSPQFQAATLTNLTAVGNAAEVPFYKQVFAIYNGASGASSATPAPGGGCPSGATFTGLPAGAPCALEFRNVPGSVFKEYQWAIRVDHNINANDRFYARFWRDNGYQPTYTSAFGPTFNASSSQPQFIAQITETHTFDVNTVNEFTASALFYSALFSPSDPTGALAALPTELTFSGSALTSVGAFGAPGPNFYVPNGRRVFQYQVLDDLSHVRGNHTFRTGFSLLHWTVTDLDFESIGGPIHGQITTDLQDFFNGGGPATSVLQAFPSSPEQGIRFNTFGGYVADDWKVRQNLTVSLNLRLESYPNPTCQANCFSRLASPFTGAPDPAAASTPYNQLILSGKKYAYPDTKTAVWEPRIGIAWKPFHNDKTVIRTGAGVFADELPGGLTEDAAFNSPGFAAFSIPNGNLAPGVPGSLFTTVANANQALLSQFKSGGSFNSISASVPGFAPPNFYSFPGPFYNATYYKWNFEVQQIIPWNMVVNVNYSGMHGSHIPIEDQGLNGYCPVSTCPNGFNGLPSAPANPALGTVFQYFSAANSNYNGLTVSLQRRFSAGLSFNFNYTWSHALDDISNGGINNIPFGIVDTDPSLGEPQQPHNFKANYGNSDYDVRHYISASFVYTDAFRHSGFHWGPNQVFGGWTLSSNWFFRTGLPFTVVDGANLGALYGYNMAGSPEFAIPLTKIPNTCNNAVNTPCLTTSQFAPAGVLTGFGTIGRNSIYGPHFFDVDLSLSKEVKITEHVSFSFGAAASNLFNHPNFDQPVNDVSNPLFGSSVYLVSPPTGILGSFLGAGGSPRFVEIKGAVRF